MKKTAYIDFDGTIVNVLPRYYGILATFFKEQASLYLDYDKYCFLKRQGLKDHVILQQLCEGYILNIEQYMAYKKTNLESEEWLKRDTVIGLPHKAYKQLKKAGFKVCILTQRCYEDRLKVQIDSLNLNNSFDDIITVKPILNQNAKAIFLKDKIGEKDIIIGDSPVEMECSHLFNIDGFFVETGLWGKQFAYHENQVFVNYNAVADFLVSSYGECK